MHMHYGTAMLRMSDDDTLTGDYYAGRDRRTFGRISCRKEHSTAASPAEFVLSLSANSR